MSTLPLRPTAGLAIGAVLALALTACGGSTSSSTPADRTVYAESTTDPTSFDPAAARAGDDFIHDGMVYDTLLTRDLDGKLSPEIASSWKAESASHYELTVRDGATCADGTPITPKVVADSLSYFADNSKGNHVFAPLVFGKGAPTITADDAAHTVTITTAAPYADLLQGLTVPQAGVICPAGLKDPEGLKAGSVKGAFSGPYVLAKAQPGVGYTYDLRDDYTWSDFASKLEGKAPGHVRFSIATDQATSANKLSSGDLDVANVGGESLARFKGTDNNRVTSYIANVYVMFNERPGHVFADNQPVRQAVARAIDRKAFNGVFSAGVSPLFNSLVPKEYTCALDDEKLIEPHDAKAAAAKLQGVRIRIVASNAFGDAGKGAEYLQKVLTDAGAKVELKKVDNATWATTTQDPKGAWDLSFMGDINAAKIIAASLDRVLGPNLEDGGRNIPGVVNPEGAKALAEGRATVDPEAQCAAYERAQRSLLENDDIVPLAGILWTTLSSPDVAVQAPGGTLSMRTVRVLES